MSPLLHDVTTSLVPRPSVPDLLAAMEKKLLGYEASHNCVGANELLFLFLHLLLLL